MCSRVRHCFSPGQYTNICLLTQKQTNICHPPRKYTNKYLSCHPDNKQTNICHSKQIFVLSPGQYTNNSKRSILPDKYVCICCQILQTPWLLMLVSVFGLNLLIPHFVELFPTLSGWSHNLVTAQHSIYWNCVCQGHGRVHYRKLYLKIILAPFSCLGTSMYRYTFPWSSSSSASDCHFRIWTQRVTFESRGLQTLQTLRVTKRQKKD